VYHESDIANTGIINNFFMIDFHAMSIVPESVDFDIHFMQHPTKATLPRELI
jgi:hypothetical protein